MHYIRTIAATLALSLAVPAIAMAAPREDKAEKGKKGDKFPMPGDQFVAHVNERIARAEERLEDRLDDSKATDEQKKKVRAAFTKAVAKLRSAAEKAAEDGTVTKAEAAKVQKLAKALRQAMRQHGQNKGGKNKGGKPRKG